MKKSPHYGKKLNSTHLVVNVIVVDHCSFVRMGYSKKKKTHSHSGNCENVQFHSKHMNYCICSWYCVILLSNFLWCSFLIQQRTVMLYNVTPKQKNQKILLFTCLFLSIIVIKGANVNVIWFREKIDRNVDQACVTGKLLNHLNWLWTECVDFPVLYVFLCPAVSRGEQWNACQPDFDTDVPLERLRVVWAYACRGEHAFVCFYVRVCVMPPFQWLGCHTEDRVCEFRLKMNMIQENAVLFWVRTYSSSFRHE